MTYREERNIKIKEALDKVPEITDVFPRFVIGSEIIPGEYCTGNMEIWGSDKDHVIDRIKEISDNITYYRDVVFSCTPSDNIIVFLQKGHGHFQHVYTIYERPKKILKKEEFRKTGKHPGEFLKCLNSKYCS